MAQRVRDLALSLQRVKDSCYGVGLSLAQELPHAAGEAKKKKKKKKPKNKKTKAKQQQQNACIVYLKFAENSS